MSTRRVALLIVGVLVLTVAVMALLVTIIQRQAEASMAYFKVTEIEPNEPDPAVWGQNFPGQYDAYSRTLNTENLVKYTGKYGGAVPYDKLARDPNLVRLFAGYPFSVEYKEDRGHLNGMTDVVATKRLGDAKPGTCITCKTSNLPRMIEELGGPAQLYATPMKDLIARFEPLHSISCSDCHNASDMSLRITRPAFIEAMTVRGIDVSKATRQEMRTYVCAQCHVEYYFKGDGKYLTFPWSKGLSIEQIEAHYDEYQFKDWDHAETKAPLVKMQHPDFELFSAGIHSRAGVACADCHMSFRREGGVKITDHWIQSPLSNLTNACTTCHRVDEDELRARVLEIQDRTFDSLMKAETALLAAQDAIKAAMAKGVPDADLQNARKLERRSSLRWDFISAESSMGFHAAQESNRVLADAIDFARQAELAAVKAQAGR